MLKIVAGKYRSRQIEVPESVTVPTKNRVREAMLSSLGNQIQGANVLDLFAGSGALGIETLSRGATRCDFVEADSKAAQVLTENLKKLKEMNGIVHCCDFRSAIASFSTPFDIVFLDPPYKEKAYYQEAVDALWARGLLHSYSTLILEYEGDLDFDPSSYQDVRFKHYGRTSVLTLRKER